MKTFATLTIVVVATLVVSGWAELAEPRKARFGNLARCADKEKCPLPVDYCAPDPECPQCLTGFFPAEVCCKEIKSYYKFNFADPKDCGCYYQCVDGKPVQHRCPHGLHWSIETDRCEFPCDARCDKNAKC